MSYGLLNELKEIKKIYGEEMMHLCRDLFPDLLTIEGRVVSILKTYFAPTHTLAKDIISNNLETEFVDLIYAIVSVKKRVLVDTGKTPFELMAERGYILKKCEKEEEIQAYRKYYAPDEVICTITHRNRLNRCYVFFAVKEDVDKIKRSDVPKRDDEYGTSVISIQFSRGQINAISIKNRYNAKVLDCDLTFDGDLENIIEGLTKSFENYYGYKFTSEVSDASRFLTEKLQYVKANDGKYYHYNYQKGGYYFCENNIIVHYEEIPNQKTIEGEPLCEYVIHNQYVNSKERHILVNRYIFDMKEKTISLIDGKSDSFIKSITDVGVIKRINVLKNGNNRIVNIYYEDDKKVEIEIDESNDIIGYKNNYVEETDDYFLLGAEKLESIELNNVKVIGDAFLKTNKVLKSINLPQVTKIGNDFMLWSTVTDIVLPNVRIIGDNFLGNNRSNINRLEIPLVEIIGNSCLEQDNSITKLMLFYLRKMGRNCFINNRVIETVYLPETREFGDNFFNYCKSLKNVYIPNLEIPGMGFLSDDVEYENFYVQMPQEPYSRKLSQGIYDRIINSIKTGSIK